MLLMRDNQWVLSRELLAVLIRAGLIAVLAVASRICPRQIAAWRDQAGAVPIAEEARADADAPSLLKLIRRLDSGPTS